MSLNQHSTNCHSLNRRVTIFFTSIVSFFKGGRVCIRFGMVSMDTDVEELLTLVVTTGGQVDEQIAKLSQMGDIVRKGIEQAAEDLKRETDEAIWQEGVLRHVPIVGSLYNWISPLQKPQIKGRFLSLNEGKLQSTEVVYKHGMGNNNDEKTPEKEEPDKKKPKKTHNNRLTKPQPRKQQLPLQKRQSPRKSL